MKLERKAFPLQVKEVGDSGEFSGYLSVFGNEDSYGDVVDPGAFAKTITDRKAPVPVLWQHYSDEPIGVYTKMTEDDHGLYVEGQLALGVQRAREAHELLKLKAVNGLSIGFTTVKDVIDAGVRRIKEVKLWEGSIVTFPANELATIEAVKSFAPAHLEELAQRLAPLLAVELKASALPAGTEPPSGTPEGKGAAGSEGAVDPDTLALIREMREAVQGRL